MNVDTFRSALSLLSNHLCRILNHDSYRHFYASALATDFLSEFLLGVKVAAIARLSDSLSNAISQEHLSSNLVQKSTCTQGWND